MTPDPVPVPARVDVMACPHCHEAVMVEFDPTSMRWFCAVCGRFSVVLKPTRTEGGR